MSILDGNNRIDNDESVRQIPPQMFLIGSAIFHYLGPSFAVLLFERLPTGGVAWLRIVSAACIFALWRRPWRSFFAADRPVQLTIGILGVVLAAMNYCFYLAIDRLPLSTVAAIEFLGPVALAVRGSRTARNLYALALVVAGVYFLTEIRLTSDYIAFVWAFANAMLFAVYIMLAHRIAEADSTGNPINYLGASMIIAGIVITPFALRDATPAFVDPIALGAGIGIGVTSSVIPYVFDQMAMAKVPRATYALFVALLPATAVIIGIVVLRQMPSIIELIGVALVALGIAIHRPLA